MPTTEALTKLLAESVVPSLQSCISAQCDGNDPVQIKLWIENLHQAFYKFAHLSIALERKLEAEGCVQQSREFTNRRSMLTEECVRGRDQCLSVLSVKFNDTLSVPDLGDRSTWEENQDSDDSFSVDSETDTINQHISSSCYSQPMTTGQSLGTTLTVSSGYVPPNVATSPFNVFNPMVSGSVDPNVQTSFSLGTVPKVAHSGATQHFPPNPTGVTSALGSMDLLTSKVKNLQLQCGVTGSDNKYHLNFTPAGHSNTKSVMSAKAPPYAPVSYAPSFMPASYAPSYAPVSYAPTCYARTSYAPTPLAPTSEVRNTVQSKVNMGYQYKVFPDPELKQPFGLGLGTQPPQYSAPTYVVNRPYVPYSATGVTGIPSGSMGQVSDHEVCAKESDARRAEAELLREPKIKFGDASDCYQFWAESFMILITRAGNLSGIKLMHALQLHTKGEANEIVMRYAKVGRASRAESLFERAWEALRVRFSDDETLADRLANTIDNFAKLRYPLDKKEVGSFLDCLHSAQIVLEDADGRDRVLMKFNHRDGMAKLASKLPMQIFEVWRTQVLVNRQQTGLDPKLSDFIEFLDFYYKGLCDSFFEVLPGSETRGSKGARTCRTDIAPAASPPSTVPSTEPNSRGSGQGNRGRSHGSNGRGGAGRGSTPAEPSKPGKRFCSFHKDDSHWLVRCDGFRALPPKQKLDHMKDHGLCSRCLRQHSTTDCNKDLKCAVCLGNHIATLHEVAKLGSKPTTGVNSAVGSSAPVPLARSTTPANSSVTQSAKVSPPSGSSPAVRSARSKREAGEDKVSLSKTQLVDVRLKCDPDRVVRCLAIVDEQACQTFADEKLVTELSLRPPRVEYSLETLAGLKTHVRGHELSGLQIRNPREDFWFELPVAYTGSHLPDTRAERATKQIVECLPSVAHLAELFEDEDEVPETLLLVGLDMSLAFNTYSEGNLPPYAHRNIFGWSIVGSVERRMLPANSLAYRTHSTGKADRVFRGILVSDVSYISSENFLPKHARLEGDSDIFQERADDEDITWSCEDDDFLRILKDGTTRLPDGRLQLPLPVREDAQVEPQTEGPVYYRNRGTLARVCKNEVTQRRAVAAMKQHLDLGHVERAPESPASQEKMRYTPIVLVNQEKKDSIRITLDGAAIFQGTSLNDILYTGPDLNNALRSVLRRLRIFPVAFSMDIRYMFNCFSVPEENRDLLRFHWWDENDPSKSVVSYRSCVHPFGACSSPGVAMFALKAIAAMGRSDNALTELQAQFIEGGFYMDDGMGSLPTKEEVIVLIKAVASYLQTFGLNLHKVNSNDIKVLEAFTVTDSSSCSLVTTDSNPAPRALGVIWDTKADVISVPLVVPDKPFTRRGILATVNSIFDPEGLAAPVVLGGRHIIRTILTQWPVESAKNWDDPLPEVYRDSFEDWKAAVRTEKSLDIPRCFSPNNDPGTIREYHVFSDASEIAIGSVVYLKCVPRSGPAVITFVCASSKLAPKAAVSMPRLELCAALLSAELLKSVLKDAPIVDRSYLYSDSMITLGYIRNTTKCFSKYVSRRIEAILRCSSRQQWMYVPTDQNPADLATRPTSSSQLKNSIWFHGPGFLHNGVVPTEDSIQDTLPETLPSHVVHRASCAASGDSEWLECALRVRSWSKLVRVVQTVYKFASLWVEKARNFLRGTGATITSRISVSEAEAVLFRASQQESNPELFSVSGVDVKAMESLSDKHPLSGLVPFEKDGLLRVGGRLRNLVTAFEEKHPVILNSKSLLAQRFAEHCHTLSPHQGKLITLHSIRRRGVFIVGGRRLVEFILSKCVHCKRLRGQSSAQQMDDLPSERLADGAPFDHIGVDVFGPLYYCEGKSTRKRKATRKLFVLLINCLSSRAIHLEPLEGMDSASFINALRRFFAVRGVCKTIVSDHGTNFIGALSESNNLQQVRDNVAAQGISWTLNPVGASHFGGAFERKIGSVRRALEAYLLVQGYSLTRDELYTVLQEAASVVNSTPLYPGPEGPQEPLALSPSMLLTLKTPESTDSVPTTEDDAWAYGRRRWRKVQFLADSFWKYWKNHYIQNLTRRTKWKKEKADLKEGDIVLLRDKQAPRCDWRIAVVRRPLPGRDGKVRRVIIALSTPKGKPRETERAVVDLIYLFSP